VRPLGERARTAPRAQQLVEAFAIGDRGFHSAQG
jgi:hypothetical protein